MLLQYVASSVQEKLDSSKTTIPEDTDNALQALRNRKSFLEDNNRPVAVEKRKRKAFNTARENVVLLFDDGVYKEYGGLIIAAQRMRRSEDDLIKNTPADGLITALGRINSSEYPNNDRALVMAYDFTVLAGTQGSMNHLKMDRVIDVARKNKYPVVLFAEGGGGRPGDVDVHTIAGLYISTFVEYAALRGIVPTIAIVNGYCFAGNAALAGSSDIIIGTKNSSLGMGGPAMIEGGGLGKFHPSEVGPSEVQSKNGVLDIVAEDENAAIRIARELLSFWQGSKTTWTEGNQDDLQNIIPANRKRTFDIRRVINLVVDQDSFVEMRVDFSPGMIVGFGRVEGTAIGIIANDSMHEAGAITSQNAVKATQFIELSKRFKLPIVSFIDTPGIMVGPEAEHEGTVRNAGNLFVAGAQFDQPFLSIVLRRAYGLGAMAMMGGSTHRSDFTVSWPTGEFGAMGLEGAVKLGFRKELESIKDPVEREEKYQQMVEEAYQRGSAINMASMMEIDDVIEPRETRSWITMALKK